MIKALKGNISSFGNVMRRLINVSTFCNAMKV